MAWLLQCFKDWNRPLDIAKVAHNDYISSPGGFKLVAPWAMIMSEFFPRDEMGWCFVALRGKVVY